MDTVSIDDMKYLASVRATPAVSIYLPTHVTGEAGLQDAIRLRELLHQAEDKLQSQGMRRCDAKELLEAAGNLPHESDFWEARSQGLAVFVSPELFRAYRLPIEFGELLTIHSRLNVKPLLPVADRGERFLLLVLSQNHVRLFQVTRSLTSEIAEHRLPENKRKALNYVGADRGQQVHSAMGGSLGKEAAVFHGQGGEKDTAKADLRQFFQIVARALEPVLRKETAPLLLAGVDYLLPIFRQTCSYAHLVERHLAGNCDLLSRQQLYERSWEIMRPYFDRPRRDAIEKLLASLGTGKASTDTAEVVAAAATGKVDVLLADTHQEQYGAYDAKTNKAVTCSSTCDGSEDLVSYAIGETLLHGGTVYAAEPRKMAISSVLAAVFRY